MRKNVAGQVIAAQLVSATDGSAFTGTVTVYVTGNAGTQGLGATGSGVCTHEGNGLHSYAPSQSETNYDHIAFTFTGTGAVPVTVQVETRVDANVTAVVNTAWASTEIGRYFASLEMGTIDTGSYLPTSSDFDLTSLGFTTTDDYRGCILHFYSGANAGKTVTILSSTYNSHAAGLTYVTVTPSLPSTPTNGDGFILIPASLMVPADVRRFGGTNGTFSSGRPEVNAVRIGGQTASASGTVTFPNATLASTTNITSASGVSLSSAGIQAIWDALTSALTTSGSIGKRIVDYLTGDAYARLGAPAGASVSADIAAVKTDTGNLVTRITSTLFSGITSLAQWLGLLAGKQTGNSTARTEIRATGGGSGTFDETTDSLEAVRDRGDSAWITGSGLDAAGVRAAVGLASANLDTQLSAIDDYIDTEVAAIKAKTDQLTFSTANRVDAQVFGMQSGTITAAAIATDAIDADALAADAVSEINAASNPLILQSTTIATLSSQLVFTLTAGSADNKAYEGCIVIVTDASTSTQKAKGVCLQYVGSTKTVRLAFDPGVFTMAAGDSVSIMAANETPIVHAELSVKSTAGSTAQLTTWMEVAGKKVPLATLDASATCSIAVREHGSGVNLFTKSGVAANITNSMFEVEQSSPGFTDDRQYELTATITLNSVAYSTTHSRVVIG